MFITKSTFIHLRLAFSYFLLPIYLFAWSQAPIVNGYNAFMVFIVWHFFIYPASNSYNSYFDKDEQSIALIKNPPKVDKNLYRVSLILDAIGILLALTVSIHFAIAVLIYGIISKMYSNPAVRLKKYPLLSFVTVAAFQGGFVFLTTIMGISEMTWGEIFTPKFLLGALLCSTIIGASYPLTQIYQHEEDNKRGDKTISIILGKKGSFIFSGLLFAAGIAIVSAYFSELRFFYKFYLFLAFCTPVIVYFIYWFYKVYRDENFADYKHTMQMNLVSGTAMLLYFLLLCFLK
jgi:4-hydroxybenzoate polyprenyltransferase